MWPHQAPPLKLWQKQHAHREPSFLIVLIERADTLCHQ